MSRLFSLLAPPTKNNESLILLSKPCEFSCNEKKSTLGGGVLPSSTENHKIYTRLHRNCESGLVIIYKHAAHRLAGPAQATGRGDSMDR